MVFLKTIGETKMTDLEKVKVAKRFINLHNKRNKYDQMKLCIYLFNIDTDNANYLEIYKQI
jgi:hypothetical protein